MVDGAVPQDSKAEGTSTVKVREEPTEEQEAVRFVHKATS